MKTLDVLEILAQFPQQARLSEIADKLGVSRPTAFQRLLTLVRAGWIEQMEDSSYRLSLKLVGMAGAALEQAHLGQRTLVALRELATAARETASLAVLQEGQPYIVQRAEADGMLRVAQPIGTSFLLHDSASGRILYAYADDAQRESIRRLVNEVPDEHTCQKVLSLGYAMSREGQDIRAIAAPIFDHRGLCISALSLVGPTMRFDEHRLKLPLIDSAIQMTTQLHGRMPASYPHRSGSQSPAP
ncbi:IclR family transcriptional regulator [Corticibacterium sp. UT-5YL-CI-8]|nr:IclR family transcriptional regulator [Tianweitania sp. UT-5YL-CI-8]